MQKRMTGNMHVFGNNIDTDQIYPGQYLDITDHEQMAAHCLEGASERFAREFQKGDIIVAGTNFGCGSSRENAAIALKVRGVACVVARSFARIFFRNAINLGLPLIVCPGIEALAAQGEPLTVDLEQEGSQPGDGQGSRDRADQRVRDEDSGDGRHEKPDAEPG